MNASGHLAKVFESVGPKLYNISPNSNGYYDDFVKMKVGLTNGEMARFHDQEKNRLCVAIGSRFGNLVFFERFPFGERGIVAFNVPKEIEDLGILPRGTNIDRPLLELMLPINGDNIIQRLNVFVALNQAM
jgi:hypothetical protein